MHIPDHCQGVKVPCERIKIRRVPHLSIFTNYIGIYSVSHFAPNTITGKVLLSEITVGTYTLIKAHKLCERLPHLFIHTTGFSFYLLQIQWVVIIRVARLV